MVVVTSSYPMTHTVTGTIDFPIWQNGTPINGDTFTGTATLTPALTQETYVSIYQKDGSGGGSILATWYFLPGSTTGTVPSTFLAFDPSATAFYLQLAPTAPWVGTPTFTCTVTINWTNAALQSVCQYGTQQKQPQVSVVEVGFGLLDALGIVSAGPWAVPLILANAGTTLALNTLCSGPPDPDPTINGADWTTPGLVPGVPLAIDKVIQKFQATAWNFF